MEIDNLLNEYMLKTPKGASHYERSRKILPGGVSGSGKFQKPYPIYVKSASGCKFTDIDGNTYVDLLMGNGVNILGHGNKLIRDSVIGAVDNPPFTFLSHEREFLLAEKISKHIPTMEMVRFANSGSEAVHMCLRAALAYTKRKKIAKFEGHFNGSQDVLLTSTAKIDGPPDNPTPSLHWAGVPQSNLENILILPFNDTEKSSALLRAHANDIAAVVLEPVTGFMLGCVPCDDGFLRSIRDITAEADIVLVFDEIVTGFRLAMGGAAEYFQIQPDMHAIGKAISGGYPICSYGGKRRIMESVVTPTKEPSDLDEKIFQSGTFTGHPISCMASLSVLNELEKGEVIPYINSIGDYMRSNIRKIAERIKTPVQVTGCGSMFSIYFADKTIRNKRDALAADAKKSMEFSLRLLIDGVYLPHAHPALLSFAHTKEDLDFILNIIDRALRKMDK
jgi:glutamate-1-semialdehyde 2,1-aminomutase